jgi:hypothetical protein
MKSKREKLKQLSEKQVETKTDTSDKDEEDDEEIILKTNKIHF